jgi:hypothetical protein
LTLFFWPSVARVVLSAILIQLSYSVILAIVFAVLGKRRIAGISWSIAKWIFIIIIVLAIARAAGKAIKCFPTQAEAEAMHRAILANKAGEAEAPVDETELEEIKKYRTEYQEHRDFVKKARVKLEAWDKRFDAPMALIETQNARMERLEGAVAIMHETMRILAKTVVESKAMLSEVAGGQRAVETQAGLEPERAPDSVHVATGDRIKPQGRIDPNRARGGASCPNVGRCNA